MAELRVVCKAWASLSESEQKRIHFFYEKEPPGRCSDGKVATLRTVDKKENRETFWCNDDPPFARPRKTTGVAAFWPWNQVSVADVKRYRSDPDAKQTPVPCWALRYDEEPRPNKGTEKKKASTWRTVPEKVPEKVEEKEEEKEPEPELEEGSTQAQRVAPTPKVAGYLPKGTVVSAAVA